MVRTPPRGLTPFLTLYLITICVVASTVCAYEANGFDNQAREDSAGQQARQQGSGGRAAQGSSQGDEHSAAAGMTADIRHNLQSSGTASVLEEESGLFGIPGALSPPGTAPTSPPPGWQPAAHDLPSSRQSHQPASVSAGTSSRPSDPPHYSPSSPGQQQLPNYPPHYGPHYPPSYSPHYGPQPTPPTYTPGYLPMHVPSLSPPALPLPPPPSAPPSPSPATSQLPALNPTTGPAPAPSSRRAPVPPPSAQPPPYPPSPPGTPPAPTPAKPNFLIIMTDDQDDLLNSTHPHYMPALNKHLAARGTRVTDFIVSTPLCCPARTSLFTGEYAHCTNITANGYPGGAYQKFVEQRLDRSYLPVWLQDAGYDTYLIGKFLNQYQERARYQPEGYFPRGWSHFEALPHENTYTLNKPCFALNGQRRECYAGQYQTDLIRDKALALIRDIAANNSLSNSYSSSSSDDSSSSNSSGIGSGAIDSTQNDNTRTSKGRGRARNGGVGGKERDDDSSTNSTSPLNSTGNSSGDGSRRPFFMLLTPTAPHTENSEKQLTRWFSPTPAKRHADLYDNETIDLPKGPNFGKTDPFLNPTGKRVGRRSEQRLQERYLARLRCIRSIDEMLDALVLELEAQGLLDNTYVIYTSDNGFHMGAFGLLDGKATSIEEDIHVPFYIRGPGIPAGTVLPHQGNMVDMAPTVLALAALDVPDSVNGVPMPLSAPLRLGHARNLLASLGADSDTAAVAQAPAGWQRDTVLLEGWRVGKGNPEDDGDAEEENTTSVRMFKALRLCTAYRLFPDSGANASRAAPRIAGQPDGWSCYKYTAWCANNNRALYDLSTDPYEIRNRLPELPRRVLSRFDGILSSLIHCNGTACRNPYAALHPGQPVYTLEEALDPKYDSMYTNLVKFRFLFCYTYYEPQYEPTWSLGIGPQPSDFMQQKGTSPAAQNGTSARPPISPKP